jgi:hypothetical protein
MEQNVVIIYTALCVIVAGIGLKFFKTTWVYLFVASLVPPMLMVGGDSLWHGKVSVWADIVFIVLFLIALGVALVMALIRFVIVRRRKSTPAN